MTRSPIHLDTDIRSLGGIASAAELLDLGYTRDALRLWGDGRRSRRVRRGWYAVRDLPEEVVAAWDAGGVLACVSLLASAGDTSPATTSASAIAARAGMLSRLPDELHICVPRTASRIPRTVPLRGRAVRVIAHWSTVDHDSGTRRGVDAATAVRQARRCARRAAADASVQGSSVFAEAGPDGPQPHAGGQRPGRPSFGNHSAASTAAWVRRCMPSFARMPLT